MNAEIGTPAGSSQCRIDATGIARQATVKRALGCAAVRPQPGVHSLPGPVDEMRRRLVGHAFPPHVAVVVSATLVKIVSRLIASIAFGLVS